MKRVGVFILPILILTCAYKTFAQGTTAIKSEYHVAIDYPNWVIEGTAKLLQIHTDYFELREYYTNQADSNVRFKLLLRTDRSEWARVSNDLSFESYTQLPLADKKRFFPNGLIFIENLFAFFESPKDTLRGIFNQGDDELEARVYLGRATAEELDGFGKYSPRLFIVETRDIKNQTPYIKARILVGHEDERRVYPYVFARLYEKDITITLRLIERLVNKK